MQVPDPASSSEDSSESFKVFLPKYSAIYMSIPRAYVSQLKEGLPRKAILKDESGKNGHVRLEKIGKDWCFTTGWQVFVRDHFLVRGDFLIFKYSGNSLFHVKIFGIDGCKKKVLDHIHHGNIGHGHVHVKVKQENIEQGNELVPQVKQENIEEGNELVPHNFETEKSTGPSKGSRGRKREIATTNLQEHCRVQKKANKCSVSPTNNPHHFAVTITHTYRSNLHIPKSFLNALRDDDVHLKPDILLRFNKKKKKWPVKMTVWTDGRYSMIGGWGEFMRNNNIKVNDKCVFKVLLGNSIGTSNKICEEMHVHVINQREKKLTHQFVGLTSPN